MRKKSVDVSFLNPKEIEDYKRHFAEISSHIKEIADIALDNKESVTAYLKEQLARREQAPPEQPAEEGEEFTLEEDLQEIQTLLKEVLGRLGKIQATNEEVRERARAVGGGEMQEQVKRLEA